MSRVRYGQSGYVGSSMSENAMFAYEDGEMPRSKWTKKAMLTALRGYCKEFEMPFDEEVGKMRKDDIFKVFFEWKGWHHTGKFATETDFYGIDEDAAMERFGGR